MQLLKNPAVTETVRLNRLFWFGYVQRMEENKMVWARTENGRKHNGLGTYREWKKT